jgi:uncharacterized protein (TIGR04255 family)
MQDSARLPSFGRPPLTEAVLSLQFNPIQQLRGPLVGIFWAGIRDQMPGLSEQPALPPMFETFGGSPAAAQMDLSGLFGPPQIRYWFESLDGTYLLQLQQDRLIFNWRKRDEQAEYPRYASFRQQFADWVAILADFLQEQDLPAILPNQCEVTYINNIAHLDGAKTHEHLERLTPLWSAAAATNLPGIPENTAILVRRILVDDGRPVGRIYTNFKPAFAADQQPIIQVEVTARGKPEMPSIDGMLSFMDFGHAAVVNAFAASTTVEMHRVWEMQDG